MLQQDSKTILKINLAFVFVIFSLMDKIDTIMIPKSGNIKKKKIKRRRKHILGVQINFLLFCLCKIQNLFTKV